MATQITRVNPLDLQKNIAIGVSLPFNGPNGKPFNSTFSTKDQIKSNLINLILTNKGERVFNPEFGADLKRILFEGITESTISSAKRQITDNINIFVPDAIVNEIEIIPDEDKNTLSITIKYSLRISGTADQITVEFI
jgi:phage baseplate assembly protein W